MSASPLGPFVRLVTVADPAAADLWAAMLRSAGIEARLHGESLGPYRLTVGEMATTEVWVPEAQFDDARAVIEPGEAPAFPDATEEVQPGPAEPEEANALGRWWGLVALGLLALLAWRLLSRLL
ncbi:MAG: DUF2007 domain-containing protein [Acidimicrobiia bacterium]|nr:DUF2007 domain-containing protein [Acidimicrobiia bacterium]